MSINNVYMPNMYIFILKIRKHSEIANLSSYNALGYCPPDISGPAGVFFIIQIIALTIVVSRKIYSKIVFFSTNYVLFLCFII